MRTTAPARTRSSLHLAFAVVLVGLVVGCSSNTSSTSTGLGQDSSSTSSTTISSTSTLPPETDTTAIEGTGLNLASFRWVTFGPDGLVADDGTVLWEAPSYQFDKAVARDRTGGLAFVEGAQLWWFEEGASDPQAVATGVPGRIVEVIDAGQGAVASLGFGPYVHVWLANGEQADEVSGFVGIDDSGTEVWSAGNAWSVWIDGPGLDAANDGSAGVASLPRLVVADSTGAVVVDEAIGTTAEPWVRIHDFDGRHLIVSYGAVEPATPPETFLVIDLACATCTSSFTAVATSASLAHGDLSTWNGPLDFDRRTSLSSG